MREMMVMLKSMREQQSLLIQTIENQQGEISALVRKVDGMDSKMNDVAARIRCLDWQRLRWRRVDWAGIPPDSRVRVIPFLAVEDILSLNCAISGKKLRKDLRKSYKGNVIPAFDQHRFTDKGNFKSLRWVLKMGVSLQACTLVLAEQEGGLVEKADAVLRWLVD